MDYRTDVGYESSREAPLGTPARELEREEMDLFRDLSEYFRQYARERPEVVAGICFGLGFVLGWRLKPW